MVAGVLETRKARHDVASRSQTFRKERVPCRARKARESSNEPFEAMPTTSIFRLFSRANRSTPRASALHTGQKGAQIHTSTGLSRGERVARSTVGPSRSRTCTRGRPGA